VAIPERPKKEEKELYRRNEPAQRTLVGKVQEGTSPIELVKGEPSQKRDQGREKVGKRGLVGKKNQAP